MLITKWKKPVCKSYILYGFNYMMFWEKGKTVEIEKISSYQGLGGKKGWIGSIQRTFKGSETILYIVMVHTYVLTWFSNISILYFDIRWLPWPEKNCSSQGQWSPRDSKVSFGNLLCLCKMINSEPIPSPGFLLIWTLRLVILIPSNIPRVRHLKI